MNAKESLKNVQGYIETLDARKQAWGFPAKLKIEEVYDDLGIFDWWNEYLSMTQLKQMKKFLETVIALGYDGYVCFKVGAAGCAHGMWAYREESTTGYSPDGTCLFHSFRHGDNYWGYCDDDGNWDKADYSLSEIKKIVNERGA